MDSSRLVLTLALALAGGCMSHESERERSELATCPGVELAPALARRIQGSWAVRHTHYERGRKPPGLDEVGTLTIEGCRFAFEADEGAALHELRRWFPAVDRPRGVVEIVAKAQPNPNDDLYIEHGSIRLNVDPGSAATEMLGESIELDLRERLQDGEYLVMTASDERLPTHTLEIVRGVWKARGDEVVGGEDPDGSASDREARRQQAETSLPRWRAEAAARAR
jgi:hypothetical protein